MTPGTNNVDVKCAERSSANQKTLRMGTEPLTGLLLRMAGPAILSMTVQSIYNIVDSYFVGQIHEQSLRAVSIVFPIQQLIIACSMGTSLGVNAYLSRSLGRGDKERAGQTAAHGFFFNTLLWLVFVLVGLFGAKPFVSAFTAEPTVLAQGMIYMQIVTIFSFGLFWEITLEKVLQATGNMILPMALQIVGALTNCLLDPLLIFGWGPFPAMGVQGAAIATVVAQILAFGIGCTWLKWHPLALRLIGPRGRRFRLDWSVTKGIYQIGIPSFFMMMLNSIFIIFLNRLLRTFSEAGITVIGVYYKLHFFVFMPLFGLSHGMMPLIGYNYGAGLAQRVKQTLRTGMALSLGFILACTALFQLMPESLIRIFGDEPDLITLGVPALRIISLCYVPATICFMYVTLYQGMGEGRKSLTISLLRQLVVLIPAAWLGAKWFGLHAVWFAFVIAETVALGVALCFRKHAYELLSKAAANRKTAAQISTKD